MKMKMIEKMTMMIPFLIVFNWLPINGGDATIIANTTGCEYDNKPGRYNKTCFKHGDSLIIFELKNDEPFNEILEVIAKGYNFMIKIDESEYYIGNWDKQGGKVYWREGDRQEGLYTDDVLPLKKEGPSLSNFTFSGLSFKVAKGGFLHHHHAFDFVSGQQYKYGRTILPITSPATNLRHVHHGCDYSNLKVITATETKTCYRLKDGQLNKDCTEIGFNICDQLIVIKKVNGKTWLYGHDLRAIGDSDKYHEKIIIATSNFTIKLDKEELTCDGSKGDKNDGVNRTEVFGSHKREAKNLTRILRCLWISEWKDINIISFKPANKKEFIILKKLPEDKKDAANMKDANSEDGNKKDGDEDSSFPIWIIVLIIVTILIAVVGIFYLFFSGSKKKNISKSVSSGKVTANTPPNQEAESADPKVVSKVGSNVVSSNAASKSEKQSAIQSVVSSSPVKESPKKAKNEKKKKKKMIEKTDSKTSTFAVTPSAIVRTLNK